jgi:two-component system, LuxR family, response regulator FixJ
MTFAIVDDDSDVRRALSRLLRAMGHHVKVFASAEDFDAQAVDVDCAIVDVRLPGLTGLELRERLRSRGSPLPVVLITGGSDRIARDVATVDTPLVTKPFDADVLSAAISAAITMTSPAREPHAH